MCILTSFTLRFYTVMKSFKNATFSNSSYFQLCRIMQSSKLCSVLRLSVSVEFFTIHRCLSLC